MSKAKGYLPAFRHWFGHAQVATGCYGTDYADSQRMVQWGLKWM